MKQFVVVVIGCLCCGYETEVLVSTEDHTKASDVFGAAAAKHGLMESDFGRAFGDYHENVIRRVSTVNLAIELHQLGGDE